MYIPKTLRMVQSKDENKQRRNIVWIRQGNPRKSISEIEAMYRIDTVLSDLNRIFNKKQKKKL